MKGQVVLDNKCISARELAGGKPIVVLAPHPDDETLGCGGLLAAAFESAGGHVICMTDGSASHTGSVHWPPHRLAEQRQRELLDALSLLGGTGDDLTWLGHPDGALSACDPAPMADRIASICCQIGAERLFSTSPLDHHADHKATADIAMRVFARCPSMQLFFYPVWSRWDDPDFLTTHNEWRVLEVNTARYHSTKTDALKAHRSQLGLVVSDAPTSFCLEIDMVRRFCEESEFYFEVL